MMELALLKTLLQRDFYDNNKGIRCPDKIFSKDVRRIKQALDGAMTAYDGDLTVSDLEAVFNVQNQSMTTATRTAYDDLFKRIERSDPIKPEIAMEDGPVKAVPAVRRGSGSEPWLDFVNGTQNKQ